jgi:elongation factor Ts
VLVENGTGAVVELTCETDFVAKGEEFRDTVAALTELVTERGEDDVESQPYGDGTVGDAIKQLGAKVGENVALGRVARFQTTDGIVDGYKHIQNDRGTIGVLVEVGGVDPSSAEAREIAHDVALHVASAAPRHVTRDDVPPEVVDKERGLLEELTRNEGKPEQAIPKIVDGRLNAFFRDNALVEQPFVRDPKTTIGELLARLGPDAEVRRFVRVKVGEE